MALQLTAAQVQGLAPDASAAAAGKKLGKPGPWTGLGQSSTAVWGQCKGSAVYQTQVALADLTSKCTCPSRKFPCKHALGLLLLAVDSPSAFSESAEPEWVSGWLQKRGEAQQKKLARTEAAANKPVDAGAQAKRANKRHESILAGLDQLDAWMNDLVRQGLGRVQSESPALWDAQARRLVDAQAPGLGSRVRQLGARVGTRGDWVHRLLDDLGQLALLSHAYRRLEHLDPALSWDVRRLVGITLEQAEVIAHGDVVEDEWQILAESIDDEDRVRVQRAWLRGSESGRSALVLQFAVGGGRFSEALVVGTKQRARLAFWPSAWPQRALIVERTGPSELLAEVPAGDDVAAALEAFAGVLGRVPWMDQTLLVLRQVRPVPGERWSVVDERGDALPLDGTDSDLLLALSGGHPLTLAGEWDGYAFAPATAWAEQRMIALKGEAP